MTLALLAAAALSAAPLSDEELIARSERACSAGLSTETNALLRRHFGSDPQHASARTEASYALVQAALDNEGVPAQQRTLALGFCRVFLSGQLDMAAERTFNIQAKWRYPDGHTVPLDEYLANLPVARP